MVMLLLVDENRRSKSEKQKTKSKPPPFAPKVHGRSGWGTRNGHDQKPILGQKKSPAMSQLKACHRAISYWD